MNIIVGIVLIIFLIITRAAIKSNAEKSGLDICPKCHKKMELGARRYSCPYCGYKWKQRYF